MRLAALVVVWLAFTGWSFTIVSEHGLMGLWTLLEEQAWGRQVFADLAISLVVAWSFLRPDAKARGIPAAPYMVATLVVGSIGLLPYLIHRELRRTP